MSAPRVPLVTLREYRSANGKPYFRGFLGQARVLMLRDDRAECTGKEVARWNVILEEPEPREDHGLAQTPAVIAPSPAPRQEGRKAPGAPPRRAKRSGKASAEQRAGDLLRERGIDPATQPNDDLPW